MTHTPFLPENSLAPIALANPLGGADQELATWFHERLSPAFVSVLHAFTNLGSAQWIGFAVFALVLFFAWKRLWPSMATLIVAVPGGMLLNEWVKVLVHRQRPFIDGPFVDWSGYSFASGHTIGATLLYGQLLIFVLPFIKSACWRRLSIVSTAFLILLVGFSRIALGAHFLTDVLAAVFFGIVWLAFCLFAMKSIHSRAFSTTPLPFVGEPALVRLESVEKPAQTLPR